MDDLCQLSWSTLLCFKITLVCGSFMGTNDAVDHIPVDKRIITACLAVSLKCYQKLFGRVIYRPMSFFVGNASTQIDDGITVRRDCVLIFIRQSIYSSTASKLRSIQCTDVMFLTEWNRPMGRFMHFLITEIIMSKDQNTYLYILYVLETHYHAHLMR